MLVDLCHGKSIENIESLHETWLLNNSITSITTAAFLWALWKVRNDLCVSKENNGQVW
jgi:hypothetical protein